MASTNSFLPSSLPADARRIVVVGTSGSGKTFLARNLSQLLGVPHVEFDAYRHGPNWTETPDDIFREQLAEALQGERWVADGNYSVTRDVVWPRATTLVWLDYPMRIVLWRLFWRVFRRSKHNFTGLQSGEITSFRILAFCDFLNCSGRLPQCG